MSPATHAPQDAASPTAPALSPEARKGISETFRSTMALIAKRLESVLAGQNARLPDLKLPQHDDEHEPPSEKLRRWLRFLNDARQRFQAGEGYGLCAACQAPLPERELVEMPWADRCRACK